MLEDNVKKVLIVDDDLIILKIISDFLTNEGYSVYTAKSGSEALEIINEYEFPVMFIDLQMPHITGYDLCKKIREHDKTSWICAITGLGSVFRTDECLEAGFDAYYIKPFNINLILKDVLKNVFDKIEGNKGAN